MTCVYRSIEEVMAAYFPRGQQAQRERARMALPPAEYGALLAQELVAELRAAVARNRREGQP